MTKAVHAKFNQNKDLKEYLKKTDQLNLVHANAHDKKCASGLAINNKNVLDPLKYTGQNILGDILMSLRDTF